MRLSVKPKAQLKFVKAVNNSSVKIRNVGTGPLLIESIKVSNGVGSKTGIRQFMPTLPDNLYWKPAVYDGTNRVIPSGEAMTLLELLINERTSTHTQFLNEVNAVLGSLSIEIEYTDIYETKFPFHVELGMFH